MRLELIKYTASLGVGMLPGPHGTWGSALTLGAAALWLASGLGPLAGPPYLIFVALFSLLAVAVSDAAVRRRIFGGSKDPGVIVIDEAAGLLVALYGSHSVGWPMLAAFALFRVFDIVKPFPVGWSQKLPGGWGVVVDDLLAGLYSLAVPWLLAYLGWWPRAF